MNDTQKQIIRQSSLKSAIEWVNSQDTKYTLSELIGITMAFEAYCTDGSFELLQRVEKKLKKDLEISK
jgi:hypothetical protein